ncbi:Glycosyl transferases group 1 [Frankineae bacterium MT45]|nr:Glycosyl transferases group 1 [Frankineae bacterium MT45]
MIRRPALGLRSLPAPTLPAELASAKALALHIDHRGPRRRQALRERLGTIITTLGGDTRPDHSSVELLEQVEAVLAKSDQDGMWLALAVIAGRLPDDATVISAFRRSRLDGPLAALAHTIIVPRIPRSREALAARSSAESRWPEVRVETDAVLVDLHHTSLTELATGIQRVARQTAQRWARDHEIVPVGWSSDMAALRRLTPDETAQALGTGTGPDENAVRIEDELVIPWRATYLLPELITEPDRLRALQGILHFSGSRSGVIGFDCVPITSAETVGDGMGGAFSRMLATVAYSDRIATISDAAAREYSGWRQMLSGAGLAGPQIQAVALAAEAPTATDASLAACAKLLDAGDSPIVLCVGSHEPRKNHLAVLQAAEIVWRRGVDFTLVFVGGNAWRSERFSERVEELQEAGRPVKLLRALSDEVLGAAYTLAACVIFPSLNEGFGLPVAEALAAGTPVITSNFGSMREIAGGGGALLVDPRADDEIAVALNDLLTDQALKARLITEAQAFNVRSWDGYAAACWQYFVADSSVPERTKASVEPTCQ